MSEEWVPTFEKPASMCPRCNWPLAEERVEPAVADEREQEWRTGRHPTDEPGPRQKTIYGPDGELRGVMFTTEDAHLVVDALNARDETTPEFTQVADWAALITALAAARKRTEEYERQMRQAIELCNRGRPTLAGAILAASLGAYGDE